MKTVSKLSVYSSIMAAFMIFNACVEEDTEPINIPGIDVIGETGGMTGSLINIPVFLSDPYKNMGALKFTWNVIESPAGGIATVIPVPPRDIPVPPRDDEKPFLTSADFTTATAGFYRVEIIVDDGRDGTVSEIVKLYIGGELPTLINTNTILADLFDEEIYPDYYAPKSVTVSAGLTIEPGVVIENGPDVQLLFNGSSAYLSAEGTAAKNIVFRGIDNVKGGWRAINVTSTNGKNKLDHVRVMHAGSTAISNQKTAIFIKSNVTGRLSITNTSISNSAGYAVYIDGNDGSFPEFANNDFSDNDAAPMRIGAKGLLSLDNKSIYNDNGKQAIEVTPSGNTNVRFENEGTVKAVGIPYHFLRSAELRSTLTFEPGVTCLFEAGMRLWVPADGVIIANGTASKNIIFSGINEASGAWLGFEIASPSTANLINHGIISYGGSSGGRGANIYMFGSSEGSKLTITNSTISNSQTYGIRKASGTVILTETNNTFSNNASGDII